jgi:hypothetical protein
MAVIYKDFVLERARHSTITKDPQLAFHALGMVCEAGEAGDVIKKIVRGDNNVDPRNFLLECGDVLYYMTKALDCLGYTIEDAMNGNIEKLTHRDKYGKGETKVV